VTWNGKKVCTKGKLLGGEKNSEGRGKSLASLAFLRTYLAKQKRSVSQHGWLKGLDKRLCNNMRMEV
jgi:hypothetical protein